MELASESLPRYLVGFTRLLKFPYLSRSGVCTDGDLVDLKGEEFLFKTNGDLLL